MASFLRHRHNPYVPGMDRQHHCNFPSIIRHSWNNQYYCTVNNLAIHTYRVQQNKIIQQQNLNISENAAVIFMTFIRVYAEIWRQILHAKKSTHIAEISTVSRRRLIFNVRPVCTTVNCTEVYGYEHLGGKTKTKDKNSGQFIKQMISYP